MITQLVAILLFLQPLDTASSTPDGQLLPISNVTAKTYHESNPPELAIDGDPHTIYHSSLVSEPLQWLELKLEESAVVSQVVIVNRYWSNTIVK